jgi:glutaredoxin 3
MQSVVLYGTRFCPYCIAARRLLNRENIPFEDIAVDNNPELRLQISERSGQTTVPQIWIGKQAIGGYTELQMLASSDELYQLFNTDTTECSGASDKN